MTEPVILFGTQSNGETLPVQVDATGRLVAEGLQGPPGQDGQPGPPGPPGVGELPSGAFEGAVLGWQEGELVWLEPSGLPQPLGTEGQIIQIYKNEPVWLTNPDVPPVPFNAVTIKQGQASPDGKFGMFSSESVLQGPDCIWDEYAREQRFWNYNEGGAQIGLSKRESNSLTQAFNLEFGFSEILQISGNGRFQHTSGGTDTWEITGTASSSNLVPINTLKTWTLSGSGHVDQPFVFTWLINRDSIGEFTIRIGFSGGNFNISDISFINIQSWKTLDAGRVALENQLAMREEVARLRAEFGA